MSARASSSLKLSHNGKLNGATESEILMLQLRPSCECCDKNLAPDCGEARICSFECTFCAACAETVLRGKCPNCGGELVARPRRPAAKLAAYPASTQRIYKPGCAQRA
jgi:hypothetical protein